MFPNAVLERIVTGEIDLAFRRWTRRAHSTGGSQRTQVGVISFVAVDQVDPEMITADEAVRSGSDLASLRTWLAKKSEGDVYRITLRFAGDDPRVELRGQSDLAADELAAVRDTLATMDRRSKKGAWTRQHLELIMERPGVRADDLAISIAREKLPFKADIRRLKELGLTESLPVGYRLSPRGEAVLIDLRRHSQKERS